MNFQGSISCAAHQTESLHAMTVRLPQKSKNLKRNETTYPTAKLMHEQASHDMFKPVRLESEQQAVNVSFSWFRMKNLKF